MKNKSIYTMSIMLSALLLTTSCSESDAVVDQIVADTTRGAALRGIETISSELPIGFDTARFEIELEMQDEEDGALVSSIDVYVAFRDNTVEDGADDLDVDEALYSTINSSEFTEGEFGLPRVTFLATLQELNSFAGLTDSDLFGGDQYQIRFEMVLTDGRTFSSTNSNASSLGGSYYNSPFIYFPTVTCPATPPESGDWTFEMSDAYGDGWNGASLAVTIDGVVTSLLTDSASSTEIITVPAGTEEISIQFVSGSWDGEIGYIITSATGEVIITQEAYTTNPTAATELINYCIKNF